MCSSSARGVHKQRAMTQPRIIVPGATVAVTRRTNFRKAFLAPWHPDVDQVWLYSMAHAQQETHVAIHYATRVITHHHLSVTPTRDNLPEFCERFHHDVSCALNTLLVRERYDAPGQLFDGRPSHYMRALDAPAAATDVVYQYNNTVAAGLVKRPEHMPGFLGGFELWRRGGIEVRRPDVFFSKDRPETLLLKLTPPPELYAAFGGDLEKLIHHMQQLANRSAMALRAKRGRRGVLGAEAILRIHPWDEPQSLRESGGRRVPSFRIGARGIVGQELYLDAVQDKRLFEAQHDEARRAWRQGEREVLFPSGTYQMRVQHGAKVCAAAEYGVLTRPGRTLEQVQAQLAQEKAERQQRPQERGGVEGDERQPSPHIALLQEVTEALVDEAEAIIEAATEDLGDLRGQTPARVGGGGAANGAASGGPHPDAVGSAHRQPAPTASTQDQERAPSLTRHRFSKRRGSVDAHGARRVITLRDKHRGKGRSKVRRPAGSDPPV